jgi:uncharacterized protein
MELEPPLAPLSPAAAPAEAPAAPPALADPARSPEPPAPRGHPALRALLYLLACLALQTAVAVGAVWLAWAATGDTLARDLGEGLLLATALTAPAVVLVTWLFVRFLDRRDLRSLGARWPDGGRAAAVRQAAAVSAATLGALALWVAAVLPFARFRVAGWSPELLAGPAWWPAPAGGVLLLVLILAGFLVQGGLEEWIVRGYVYHALRERWSAPAVAVATSLLFAAMHAANPGFTALAFANTFLAGMVLAALVERSGSLWPAAIAHGVWNFAVSSLLSLPVSGVRIFRLLEVSLAGPEAVAGGEYGPEGSLLLTPILVALVLLFFFLDRRRQSPSDAQRWSVA